MSRRKRIVVWCLAGFGGMALFSGLLLAGGVIYALLVYGRDLPDYRQLADYEPPVMTRYMRAMDRFWPNLPRKNACSFRLK